MKQNLNCTTIENDDRVVIAMPLFSKISLLILPLEDHLVGHLVGYQAFDTQSAFANLDLN